MAINPQGLFPDYPRESPTVDKNGNLMPYWDLGLGALFQALQTNFSNEGITIPPLTNTQIMQISALYAPYVGGAYNTLTTNLPDISGRLIYNVTNSVPQIFIITVAAGNVASARWWTFAIT